jgi:hypothetical protein
MAIFGNSPIDDRMTKIEEAIEELRQDLSILLAEVMRMQVSNQAQVVQPTDQHATDRTNGQNQSVTAALRILSVIPFTHDLDDREMHECYKFSDRIYRAKMNRERQLECPGRLPVQSQILAWLIMNYRTVNPSAIDNERFIDGLFSMAECTPTVFNWNLRENNAFSFKWMDHALVIAPHPDREFPF